jgi:antitoxin ParD1/3/4
MASTIQRFVDSDKTHRALAGLPPGVEARAERQGLRNRLYLSPSPWRGAFLAPNLVSKYLTPVAISEHIMAVGAKRTFSLPLEQSRYIDSLVQSGAYATSSEVIRSGLRALQERDAAVERWLREDVVPVAAAMKADPSLAIPLDEVFGEIRALHKARAPRDP